jgi:hypothetical protein
MSLSNEELVQKAVITTDALAAAGKLNPAQSDKFLDFVVDETVLKNNARVVRFRNESLEIDKLNIGVRVSMPKAEAQDPGLRRGVSTSKIPLTPKEIVTPFEIGDLFKEVNIEGEQVEQHIVQMMAKATGNDLEELYINGDTLGPAILESNYKDGGSTTEYVKDNYLALQDGWAKLATGAHVVDAAGANIGLSIFGKLLRALPTKFRRNKNALRWFISPDLWQLYLEKLATRATALGDAAAAGAEHGPFGVRAVPVPLWDLTPPVVKHVVLSGTTPVSLGFAPVADVVVTPNTLANTATVPYVDTTDYVVNLATGMINRTGGGAIGDGDTVKVTFNANPQIILTHQDNFIVGIGRDIKIEKDRNIYKGTNEYAIHTRVSVNYEELDAVAFGKNIGSEI